MRIENYPLPLFAKRFFRITFITHLLTLIMIHRFNKWLFISLLGFSLQAQNDTFLLSEIRSTADLVEKGQLKAADSILNTVGGQLDSSYSPEVLFGFYEAKGSLSFNRHDFAAASKQFEKALDFAQILGDSLKLTTVLSAQGNVFNSVGEDAKALDYYDQAISYLPKGNEKKYYAILLNKSTATQGLARYDETLKYLEQARNYFTKTGNTRNAAISENNIGEVYRNHLEDYDKALKHYKAALALNLASDDKIGLARNNHNLGVLHKALGDLELAAEYLQKSMDYRKQTDDLGGMASTYNMLGSVSMAKGEFIAAEKYFQKSLEISERFGIMPGIYHNNLELAQLDLEQGNTQAALGHINLAADLASQSDDPTKQAQVQEALYTIYLQSEDYQKAVVALEKLKALEDSIDEIKQDQDLNLLRSKFETNLAETENALLKAEQKNQVSVLERQRWMLIGSLIVAGLILMAGLLLFRALKQRNRAYRLEHKRKKQLDQHYALLKTKEKQLSQTNDLKNKILSVLGHDLRAPLASVSTLLDVLTTNDMDKQELDEIFGKLKEDIDVSLFTLKDILNWARLQMDENGRMIQGILVKDLLMEAVGLYKNRLIEKEVDVELNVPEGLEVLVDRNQMRSITGNLLSNALKFSPPKGTIWLSAAEKEDEVLIAIEDQGQGISEQVLLNLNNRDELLSKSGTVGEEGTGIGLRIVQDFILAHGGSLRFKNRDKGGTRVEVCLPKKSQAQLTASLNMEGH